MKKVVSIFIMIFFFVGCGSGKAKNVNINNEDKGIYVLSSANKICYVSSKNYNKINEKDVNTTLYITHVKKDKIYVPICDGKSIGIFKGGRFIGNIKLTYSLPLIGKYNDNDNNTYVFHKTKISNNKENCITVIDSKKDCEKLNIKYNKGIEDITFTKDNKMVVSSWSIKNDNNYTIDVFNLKNYSIIKEIKIPFRVTSMRAINSDLVYLVSEQLTKPYIYILSIKEGRIIDKIKLPYDNPYRISYDVENGKEYIYVLHQNYDSLTGRGVSIIDCKENKVIDKIDKVDCPESIYINKDKLFISNWRDNKVYVIDKKNKKNIEKEIEIFRPNLGF